MLRTGHSVTFACFFLLFLFKTKLFCTFPSCTGSLHFLQSALETQGHAAMSGADGPYRGLTEGCTHYCHGSLCPFISESVGKYQVMDVEVQDVSWFYDVLISLL